MGKKTGIFEEGQHVFARIRGHPYWPSVVSKDDVPYQNRKQNEVQFRLYQQRKDALDAPKNVQFVFMKSLSSLINVHFHFPPLFRSQK